MLLIYKNQNNILPVTLQEKTTLDNPTYLFKFTNQITGKSVRFIAANQSEYTYRIDRFLITETSGTLNLTSGVIELSPAGFWDYEVFEQESTTNLDERLSTKEVERGRAKVIGDTQTSSVYDNTPKTYITYGG